MVLHRSGPSHTPATAFCAFLALEGDASEDMRRVLMQHNGSEQHINDTDWFPCSFADTPQKAMEMLSEKLKGHRIISSQMTAWYVKVTTAQAAFGKIEDEKLTDPIDLQAMAEVD